MVNWQIAQETYDFLDLIQLLTTSCKNISQLQTPVTLKGCNINLNKTTDNLEVKVLYKTKVQESKRAITVQDAEDKIVQIAQSKLLPDYKRIQIEAKILTMLDQIKISAKLTKQDVVIGDSSGTMKLTVSNDDVGSLQLGESYHFTNLQVRTYRQQKFLTTTFDGLKKKVIEKLRNTEDINFGVIELCNIVGVNNIVHLVQYVKCFKKLYATMRVAC